MDPETTIMQWNANGLGERIKLGEIERMLTTYNPMCICIQHVGEYDKNIKNYQLACQSPRTNGELGTMIYVHNRVTYDKIQFNANSFQP